MSVRLDKGQIEVMDDAMAEVLRNKTPAERMGIGFEMWTSARKMLDASFPSEGHKSALGRQRVERRGGAETVPWGRMNFYDM